MPLRPPARAIVVTSCLVLACARPVWCQTTGRIIGRVVEAETKAPVSTAEVRIEGEEAFVLTSEDGDFTIADVPIGQHRLRIERLGFHPLIVNVRVRADRVTQVTVQLQPAPLEVEGVAAEVERLPLIEPDVTVSHEVVTGRQLRELPIDEVEQAVELVTGVNDGHFRGSRTGQESYRIDGLEVKNSLEASTQGAALELAPSALAEMEVVTGGFGVDNAGALAGVVSYVTRRGNSERWEGRLALQGDHWAPDDLSTGFSTLSASLGGPLRFLGANSTIFADLLVQGMLDSDPRARGLTCLRPEDTDAQLASTIEGLRANPTTTHLYCPFTASRLPYQRGDRLIGFVRFDQPLSASTTTTFTFLHNRRERELYTPEFKYNPLYQLGQQTKGYLASVSVDWLGHSKGRAYRLVGRVAAMRLDRYLGVIDPWTFSGRSRVAGFGFADFRFLGEEFARSPIEEQLTAGVAIPGYEPPSGYTGTPFGPAAEGIFFTQGTPGLANWNRSDFIGADLIGEYLWTAGHALRAGVTTRFHRIESYERSAAYLAGSLPTYARFSPKTLSAYLNGSGRAAHNATIEAGLRLEAYQPGLTYREDRVDFLSPAVDTDWHLQLLPRVGLAMAVPGTEDRTMLRFNYGLIAQRPDFRFFLDTTIGDSLRTDIRRQGNPNLAFENGSSWEFGLTTLVAYGLSISGTVYYKELNNLVTSALPISGAAENQFTTGDFGNIKGLELVLRGIWPAVRFQVGYGLQSAKGVTSSPFEDPGAGITEARLEFPLAFDNRHAFDATVFAGHAAGAAPQSWGLAVTGSARSGYPISRLVPEIGVEPVIERLPWTYLINVRATYDFRAVAGCGHCTLRLIAEGRNMSGQDNIVALRRDTGTIAPELDDLRAVAEEVPSYVEPIPLESSRYSAQIDFNGDGRITADELRTGRFAAALDRNDPSLYFGAGASLRLGIEFVF
jgi:hypothetical protein